MTNKLDRAKIWTHLVGDAPWADASWPEDSVAASISTYGTEPISSAWPAGALDEAGVTGLNLMAAEHWRSY